MKKLDDKQIRFLNELLSVMKKVYRRHKIKIYGTEYEEHFKRTRAFVREVLEKKEYSEDEARLLNQLPGVYRELKENL